jgi:hypothetical protein
MAFVFDGRTQSCGAQRIPQNCTEAIEWGAPVRPNLSEPSPPHCDKVFTSVAIRDHLIQIFGAFRFEVLQGLLSESWRLWSSAPTILNVKQLQIDAVLVAVPEGRGLSLRRTSG